MIAGYLAVHANHWLGDLDRNPHLQLGNKFVTRALSSIAISLVLILPILGCKEPLAQPAEKGWIISDDTLNVENGKITEGPPELTEAVEQEIYKTLNHRRKMITSIEKGSGSNRGLQQMNDELEILSKGFMSRYELSQSEIDEILEKGDSNAWK